MKKLLIASVAVAAIGLGGLALAQPAGPGMRHHEPVKEIVEHLRGISLSDAQREEIKHRLKSAKPGISLLLNYVTTYTRYWMKSNKQLS